MPKKPQIAQPRKVTPADSFVSSKRNEGEAGPTKRITIIVSDDLHYRIKRSCVDRRINMADAIRDVLEKAPWPTAAEAA